MIKILAIDDNNDNLVALSATLRISMPEVTVITTTTGKIGIELAEKEQPDVILLDIIMPGMDGYEVCGKLKELELVKHIPIIMLTAARTDSESKIKALNLGADAFLAKPIESSELMAQIRAMLRIKKSEDVLRNEKDYLDHIIKERTRDLEKELVKRIETEEKLRGILKDLEQNKRASLNLMNDLQREVIEKKETLERLETSKLQLRELNNHSQNIRENERAEISREIHDVIGQALTALKFDLSWVKNKLSPTNNEISSKFENMNKLIDDTTSSVQRISTELRPGLLDDLGLTYALEWQCDEFANRMGVKCKLKLIPKDISLNEKISVGLFRIVQEALTNVARHAKATEVKVVLSKNYDNIELKIVDNGIGINEKESNNPKSLGLLGITERVFALGGKVSFIGKKDIGTEVKVVIQLENEDELLLFN